MAFNTGVQRNQNTNAAQQNDSWKAQAFINIYIPTPDGGKRKLGSIPLKDSKQFDAKMIERLKEEGGLEALHDALIIDFQMADKEVSSVGF
jgi:hypothetical protein